jgi:hypothetical protein
MRLGPEMTLSGPNDQFLDEGWLARRGVCCGGLGVGVGAKTIRSPQFRPKHVNPDILHILMSLQTRVQLGMSSQLPSQTRNLQGMPSTLEKDEASGILRLRRDSDSALENPAGLKSPSSG